MSTEYVHNVLHLRGMPNREHGPFPPTNIRIPRGASVGEVPHISPEESRQTGVTLSEDIPIETHDPVPWPTSHAHAHEIMSSAEFLLDIRDRHKKTLEHGGDVGLLPLLLSTERLQRVVAEYEFGHHAGRMQDARAEIQRANKEIATMAREGASDRDIYHAVLDRFYNPSRFRYAVRHNDVLSAFGPEPRADGKGRPTGNCEARALAIAMLLEHGKVGNNLWLETFADHVRVVAEDRHGERFVLEGATVSPWKHTPGTVLVTLADVKRSIVGLPTEMPLLDARQPEFHRERLRHGVRERNVESPMMRFSAVARQHAGETATEDDPEAQSTVAQTLWAFQSRYAPEIFALEERIRRFTGGKVSSLRDLTRVIPAAVAGLFLAGATVRAAEEGVRTPEDAAVLIHEDLRALTDAAESVAERIWGAVQQRAEPAPRTTTVYEREGVAHTNPQTPHDAVHTQSSFEVVLVDRDSIIDDMTRSAFVIGAEDIPQNHGSTLRIEASAYARTTDTTFWAKAIRENIVRVDFYGKHLSPISLLASAEFPSREVTAALSDHFRTRVAELQPLVVNVNGTPLMTLHFPEGEIHNIWNARMHMTIVDEKYEEHYMALWSHNPGVLHMMYQRDLNPALFEPEMYAEAREEIAKKISGAD